MAEIPLSLVQRRVSRGGDYAPAGAVRYPGMSTPPGGLAESIGQAGRAVAGSLATVFEVQQRERQAADMLTVQDSTAQYTDLFLAEQQNLLADQSIPPLELRERLEQKRSDLLSTHAEQLPARLRPRFLAAARQASVQPLYHIDQVGVQRLGEQAKTTYEHRSNQLLRQTLQSTSPVERQALQTEQDTLIEAYAGQGLFAPEHVPVLKQAHRDKVVLADEEQGIRTDPAARLTQYLKGPADNPTIPPEQLTKLTDTAYSALSRQVAMQEASENKAQRLLEDKQGQQASTYRMQIYQPGVKVEDLTALVGPINQDRAAGRLSEGDHAQLLNDIHTITGKVTDDAYKDRDLPAVAQQGWMRIELAETTAQQESARNWVMNHRGELSATTTQQMLGRIDTRKDKQSYTNQDAYKEGRQLMLAGAFPGGIVPAALDKIDEGTRRNTALALQDYAAQMQQIYEKDGVEAGNRKARELAVKMRDLYFPKPEAPGLPGQAKPIPGIPPGLPPFQSVDEAAKYLEESGLPEALKDQYYEQYKKHLPARGMQQEYEQQFRTPAYQQEFQQRYPGAKPPQGTGTRLEGYTPVPPATME